MGSVNNIIDIDTIADIIRYFRKSGTVRLHIIGEGEKRKLLVRKAQAAGAITVFHGVLFNKTDLQRIFDQCHFGLNIMKASVCVGMTMKSIDYMESGLPIINNIGGDTWKAVEQYRLGYNWKHSDNRIIYDPLMRSNIRRYFENHHTYDSFRKNAVEVIEKVLNK